MSAGFAIARQRPLDEPRPLLRVVTEDDLFRGTSRGVIREEACACGGTVTQLAGEIEADAVVHHNATIAHLAWRAQQLEP